MTTVKKIQFYDETILNHTIEDYKTLVDLKADKRALIMQGEVLRRITHELNQLLFPNDEL